MGTRATLHSGLVTISSGGGDVSITVPAGTVALLIRKAGTFAELASAGVGAAEGAVVAATDDGDTRYAEVWQILSPPTGAQTLALRTVSSLPRAFMVVVDALSGVGAVRTPAALQSFGANRSVDLVTAVGDLVFDVITQTNALSVADARTVDYTGAPGVTGGGNIGLSSRVADDVLTTMGWTHGSDRTALIAVAYPDAGGGGGSGDPALVVDDQPSATPSGYQISPDVVVRATTDGSTTDTAFSGDVTASLVGSGGALLGTVTVAAAAGVATFANLRPCEAGSYALQFTATGFDPVESDPFTVTSGTGTTILGGDVITVPIRRNEGTATLRRLYMLVYDEAGAPWAGDVTGVKASMSTNGGAETPSPADIVRVGGELHYVESAQPYTDVAEGSRVFARLAGASGRRPAVACAEIIPNDSYAPQLEEDALLEKIVLAANGGLGFGMRKDPDNNRVRVTLPSGTIIDIPAEFNDASRPVDAVGTT